MTRMMIRDKDWEKIQPLLLGGVGKQGRPSKNARLIVEGIFWVLRTGVPWRDLPKDFGSWKTIYNTFNRWTKNGVWENIWNILKKKMRMENPTLWTLQLPKSINTPQEEKEEGL